jgi:hypothetical protein
MKINVEDITRMANAMTESQIINEIEKAIFLYKTTKDIEDRRLIQFLSLLFQTKCIIESNGIDKTIKDSDEIIRIMNRLNSIKYNN